MAKKPWGGAGAWATESELADAQLEQLEQEKQQQHSTSVFAGAAAFPSLGEAAHTKIPKKKKQSVSLAKFIAGGTPVVSEVKGLTTQEKMALPTGPRDRSGEEELLGGLGGGFRDYGGYRGEGPDRDFGRDREGGFGGRRSEREGGFGRGGFTGDRDASEEQSRADTVDDWGASKKSAPPGRGRYEDDGRRGGRFDDRDFPSKADDDNHWGSSKKFVPAPPSSGAGRRVSKYDFSSSRGGPPLDSSSSKADDADSWAVTKKGGAAGGYDSFGQRDKDFWNLKEKDVIDSDLWTRKDSERATERPRLVLQPRTQRSDISPPPAPKENTENEPPSSDFLAEPAPKPHKVNPFGEAKPREVVLEEKGLNWKERDAELDHKTQDRSDREELALKEALKLAEDDSNENEEGAEGLAELKNQLNKEQELQQLKATLRTEKSSSGFWGSSERKDSDVWSRQFSNGARVTVEKRGGRW